MVCRISGAAYTQLQGVFQFRGIWASWPSATNGGLIEFHEACCACGHLPAGFQVNCQLILAYKMLRAASHEAGNTSSSEQCRPKQQHASSWPSRLAEMGAASCGASTGKQRSEASGRRAAIGADPSLTRAAAATEQWRRREQRRDVSSGSPSPGHHRGRAAGGAYEQQSGGGQRTSCDPFLNHGHPPSNGASGPVMRPVLEPRPPSLQRSFWASGEAHQLAASSSSGTPREQ
ncbi:hypothetical protein Dimus_021562 [Dionaea muscipula]